MSRFILSLKLCAFIFLALFIGRIASAQDWAEVNERAEKCVVRVNVETADGGGHGSGYLVDDQGTIVTNSHVIAGAVKAKVIFADNSSYEVQGTVHIDRQRDIAILKVSGLPKKGFLQIAPELPRKGETVAAIGAPLGLDFTMTMGIVSSIRSAEQMKQHGLDDRLGTWLQVDAAISPGNSGGPLLNGKGYVIGMSTMVLSTGQNLNFGISCVDIAQAVQQASTSNLVALADGAAKTKPPTAGGGSGPGKVPPVPKSAISQYVNTGRKDFAKLVAKLKTDVVAENKVLKDFRDGEVTTNLPNEGGRQLKAVKVVNRAGKDEWYFLNDKVKGDFVTRQQDRCKQLAEVYKTAKVGMSEENVREIVTKAGPELDTRRLKSVGFARDVRFMETLDEGLGVVIYQGKPYFAHLESMAGLYPGEMLIPCAMYVRDTVTAKTDSGSITLTVLQQVPDDAIQEALTGQTVTSGTGANPKVASAETAKVDAGDADLFGDSSSDRTWTAKGGQQIRGVMLSKTSTHVKIKRTDNQKIIDVKIDSLSDADKKYLAK